MIDTTVLLYDLFIFSGSKLDLLDLMYLRIKGNKGLIKVATPNPEQVIQAHQSQQFLSDLQHFDLLLPDGQGLVWASRLLSGRGNAAPLKERITGREVVADLLVMAEEQNLKVLVLGGRKYAGKKILKSLINAKASQEMILATQKKSSETFSISWLPAYVDITAQKADEEKVVKEVLKQTKPDLVFVAFGAPYQESWIMNHEELLKESGVRLVMAVGGTFDYLLGNVSQVPTWVSAIGFEWLFRLITQPWRWQRQLRLISFIGLTFKTLVSNKKPTL